jgi:alpha-beta hydrolase superfamily lysophospholipase
MPDLAVPTWIPHDSGPLFAWLHRPLDGRSRATVVICPPLAREHDASHGAIRVLAERLAWAGIAAVRFDYYGTGDSAGGEDDETLVDSWLASIRAVVAFAREAGERHVVLAGLRMGATLAATVAAELAPFEALVSWDPCVEGRAFVREQYMLQRLTLRGIDGSGAPEGWTEIPGGCLSPDTTEQLRTIELPAADKMPATPLLLLTRVGEAPPPPLRELIARAGVTHLEVSGQPELLQTPPSEATIPFGTIEAIVSYLSAVVPLDTRPLDADTPSHVSIPRRRNNHSIVERAVRLGPKGLFGIVTETHGDPSATVVFLNAFFDHHLGPSRQWVELSRQWAEQGVQSLRFDTSGLGDSPLLPVPPLYSETLVDDAVQAGEDVSLCAGRDVVFVGLCSGAWVAAMAARRLGARAANLINQMYWNRPVEDSGDETTDDPVAFLHHLSASGVRTTLFLSAQDHECLVAAAGQGRIALLEAVDRDEPAARIEVVRIDALDHDVLSYSGRRLLAERLTEVVLGTVTQT